MDTSTGPATFTFQAHVTDDIAGLRAASIWFESPSRGQSFGAPFNGTNLSSGTANDGVITATAVLPAYSEQGTWHLTRFSMTDQASNMTTINGDTLAAAGYPTTFDVVRTG